MRSISIILSGHTQYTVYGSTLPYYILLNILFQTNKIAKTDLQLLTFKWLWRQKSQDLIEPESHHGCGCLKMLTILFYNVCNAVGTKYSISQFHIIIWQCNNHNFIIYRNCHSFSTLTPFIWSDWNNYRQTLKLQILENN